MDDIRQMTVGGVVDFCIDYNNRMAKAEKEEKKREKKRKATQMDIDAFFG